LIAPDEPEPHEPADLAALDIHDEGQQDVAGCGIARTDVGERQQRFVIPRKRARCGISAPDVGDGQDAGRDCVLPRRRRAEQNNDRCSAEQKRAETRPGAAADPARNVSISAPPGCTFVTSAALESPH
jgi:hypothetical protein